MNNNIKIGLRGQIEISSVRRGHEEIIFKDNNQIEPDAIKIITRCLTQIDFSKSLDAMEASGDFPPTERSITSVQYPADNIIELTCIFEEPDFNGTVTDLKMKSSALGLIFSSKTGLSINKDDEMRLRVKWTITIN